MDIVVSGSNKFTMDVVVATTGVLRLLLLCVVFAMNCRALLKVCFRSNLCVHNMITTAVILANILYMVTWPPFVAYSLSDGTWTLVTEQVYCLSQNYAINAMGMVFMSLLTVRTADRVRHVVLRRPPLGGLQTVTITFLMWIFPQLTYDLVSISWKHRLCQSPTFHFLGKIVNIVPQGSKSGYTLGFMVCQQEVNPVMLHVHLWQYLVLVLPLSAITVIGMLLLSIRKSKRGFTLSSNVPLAFSGTSWPTKNTHGMQLSERTCQFQCLRRMVVVDLILYCNFIWHLIGRPLLLLQVLFEDIDYFPRVFLDAGSHVMLAISCVIVPAVCIKMSCNFKNEERTKFPLVNIINVPMAKNSLTNTCLIKSPVIETEQKTAVNNFNAI